MNKLGEIKIKAQGSRQATIDIEGVIGIPEGWQFEEHENVVATYEKFKQTVTSIAELGVEKVRVNIHSIGGNVEDALLIYEALCSLDAHVETHCHGYVASAATIIAQAGGYRTISANALYLVHNATTAIDGNSSQAQRAAELLSKTDNRIARIYADRSGGAVEDFLELMGRDAGRGEWLTAQEVLDFGLADKIIEMSPLKNLTQRVMNLAMSLGLGGQSQMEAVCDFGDLSDINSKKPTPEPQLKNLIPDTDYDPAADDEPPYEIQDDLWDQIMENGRQPYPDQLDVLDRTVGADGLKISNLEVSVPATGTQEYPAPSDKNTPRRVLRIAQAQMEAQATETLPCEDPALEQSKLQGNLAAYTQDVQKFHL